MSIKENQIKGQTDVVVGKVKEVIGEVLGNKELELKGFIQKNSGVLQKKINNEKSKIRKIID